MAVCAFYSAEFGHAEALDRMRTGTPLYNVTTGGANTEDSGYQENAHLFMGRQIELEFLPERQFGCTFDAVAATD